LGRPNGDAGTGNEPEKSVNCWNHAAEKRLGPLNKSAAKEGGMLAKPDCSGVSAAASFSTRVNGVSATFQAHYTLDWPGVYRVRRQK
jgi:hypothetical protein